MGLLSLHRHRAGVAALTAIAPSAVAGRPPATVNVDEAPFDLRPPATGVALPDRLARRFTRLGDQLGPAYDVRPGPVDDAEIAVIEAGRLPVVGFLRARHPDLAIVAVSLSSTIDPADAVAHLEAGADDHVTAPGEAELAARIRSLWRRRSAHRAR